jgi:hypothetical protein
MIGLYILVIRWKKKTIDKIGDPELVSQLFQEYSSKKFRIKFILFSIAFTIGVIALANPRLPMGNTKINRSGIDVMIALDVSKSMLAQDIKPDRLERAKQVLSKLIDQYNYRNIFFFSFSMILVMSFSPVTLALFVSYLIYVSINFYKKKFFYKLLNFFFLSLCIYIFLNFEYLSNTFMTKQFEPITYKFFISYFFSSFFGTYTFGGFMLIIIILLSIINFKKNILDSKILLIYLIVITTYSLLIIKSISSNLLIARYVIFILPFILILIVKNLEDITIIKNKLLKYNFIILIIFFSLFNTFYKINDRPIKKPPTNELIIFISQSPVTVVTSENLLFGNYFRTHYLFKKNNLQYLNYEQINDYNKDVWIICAHNMRANVAKESLKDFRHVKCNSKVLDFKMKVAKTVNIPDLQATLYINKN